MQNCSNNSLLTRQMTARERTYSACTPGLASVLQTVFFRENHLQCMVFQKELIIIEAVTHVVSQKKRLWQHCGKACLAICHSSHHLRLMPSRHFHNKAQGKVINPTRTSQRKSDSPRTAAATTTVAATSTTARRRRRSRRLFHLTIFREHF